VRLTPDCAPAYCCRAEVYRRRGDCDRTLADCDAALRLDPKAAGAYANRAYAYLGKGDWGRAAADSTTALALAPDDEPSHYVRGIARFHLGRYAGAADDFGGALRLTPPRETTWKAYLHLCRACSHAYQRDPARAAADLAVAVLLDRSVLLRFRVWYTPHAAHHWS
jgi:tetratricopeptide (TPR) repeat protein